MSSTSRGLLIASTLAVALIGGFATTAHADDSESASATAALVGGFGLGDGLEGGIDELSGGFELEAAAGGLPLSWDSARLGVDRYGLGAGWSWRTPFIDTAGAIRVFPATGGVFDADASSPSGLDGHSQGDLRFEATPGGRAAPRADGVVGERDVAFVLHELGGVTTAFDAAGDPIMRSTATGQRIDWLWSADCEHRLLGVVNADGVRTELDWRADGQAIRVLPASNVASRVDDAATAWRIELREGRVAEVHDPLGGRLAVATDGSALVTALEDPSGATTELRWHASDDGAPQLDEARLVDAGGELSRRRFSATAAVTPSGWPLHSSAAAAFEAARAGADATRTTELSDGRTRVASTTNALGLLVSRRIVAATPSGDRVLHDQRFTYPGPDARDTLAARGSSRPAAWSSPTVTTVRHHGTDGGTREARQTTTYDEFGRVTEVAVADGTRTSTEYDRQPAPAPSGLTAPDSGALPMGLPLVRRTVAADGQTTETRYQLNEDRTAAVVTEQFAAAPGSPLERIARTEVTVEPDGFVSEQRVFPNGDPTQTPAVTAWSEHLDPAAGTSTRTTIAAAGTPLATTTTSVVSLVHGAMLRSTDAIGRTASADYDELGRVVRTTDAAGRTTTTRYETAQRDGRNAVTVTRPDGVAITRVLDSLGRLERITDNVRAGEVTAGAARLLEAREYPDPATVEVTDAWGATTTMRQDVFGRTIETAGADGLRRMVEHDDVAMTATTGVTPTSSLADAELVTAEQRDSSGRIVHRTATRADLEPTSEARFGYDGLGRAVSSEDGVVATTTEYDRFGNAARTAVTAVDGSAGVLAESAFDGFGASLEKTLTPQVDSAKVAGQESAVAWLAPRSGGARELDVLGRPSVLTDQLGRSTTVAYTADGLPETVRGPAGETTAYRYDPHTRQVVEAVATDATGSRVAVASTYDRATGRLTSVFDPADPARTRIAYDYDADGNLLRTSYPDGHALSHAYDDFGRKTSSTDIEGHVTEYGYDAVGRLTSARQFHHGDRARPLAEARYTYDTFGRISSVDRGNGVRTRLVHDSAGMVTGEHTAEGERPIADRSYAYDVHGNVIRRTDTVHETGASRTTTTVYRYDALDRLLASTVHLGDSADAPIDRHTTYEVTAAADVASETVTRRPGRPDESVTSRTFGYDALGELTELTVSRDGTVERHGQQYDPAGNLVRRHDGTEYAYDAANRVIRETSPDGTVIATDYWANGLRRQRTVASAGSAATGEVVTDQTPPASGATPEPTTTYYWDGGTLMNETHAGSPLVDERGTASYLLGVLREARTSVDDEGRLETQYAVADRHGSVTELLDQAGSPAAHFDYDDYGGQPASGPSPESASPAAAVGHLRRHPFRFAGELTDGDGTQYLRARTYDPGTKRFLTKDRAERQNLYHFADANPIVNVDPSGREPQVDFGLAIAGLALSFGALVATPYTGGSALAWFGSVAATAFDFVVATIMVADRIAVHLVPDDWAFGLAVASTVIGVGAVAGSLVSLGHELALRAANRIGANMLKDLPVGVGAAPPPRPAVRPPHSPATEIPHAHPNLYPTCPLTQANLERPQDVFPYPLRRMSTSEALKTNKQLPKEDLFVTSFRKRATPSRHADEAHTPSDPRRAVIEDPAYESPHSTPLVSPVQPTQPAVRIEHPMMPDEELVTPKPIPAPSTSHGRRQSDVSNEALYSKFGVW